MAAFDDYLTQLRACMHGGQWYPALALALALPDICASLDGIEGNYEQRVVRWLKGNQRLLALDPHVVYRIRCAFLHNGTGILGEEAHPRGRLTLLAPPSGGLHTAQVHPDGTQYGDVRLEVDDIVSCLWQAAGRWAQERQRLLRESEANGKLLAISPNPAGVDVT
jgi:hypothetical protein